MILVGDFSEEAVRCFQRLSELDPNSSHAHFGLGIKACQDKKYEDALKSIGLGELYTKICRIHCCLVFQFGAKLMKVKLEKNVSFRPEVMYIIM